ncbi:MAG: 4-(cytidine 5'-diphospho)-2-C-methyl-D-erythritol kinase [Traorella sp.]
MKRYAYAKINAALNVVNKREDGYHELEMVMLPLTLCDDITIKFSKKDWYTWNLPHRINGKNTIVKAVNLMRETYGIDKQFRIHVLKRIPTQAGLAGGSADAACVMLAIRDMCKIQASDEEIAQLSKNVGADVPFCVMNQASVVRGIGEILEPFEINCDFDVFLLKPKKGVSTKECFESIQFDECIHPNVLEVKRCLEENDFESLSTYIANTLEVPACKLVNEIEKAKNYLKEKGFEVVCMSGSGSTIFALTRKPNLIEKVKNDPKYSTWFQYKCKILKK